MDYHLQLGEVLGIGVLNESHMNMSYEYVDYHSTSHLTSSHADMLHQRKMLVLSSMDLKPKPCKTDVRGEDFSTWRTV